MKSARSPRTARAGSDDERAAAPQRAREALTPQERRSGGTERNRRPLSDSLGRCSGKAEGRRDPDGRLAVRNPHQQFDQRRVDVVVVSPMVMLFDKAALRQHVQMLRRCLPRDAEIRLEEFDPRVWMAEQIV